MKYECIVNGEVVKTCENHDEALKWFNECKEFGRLQIKEVK